MEEIKKNKMEEKKVKNLLLSMGMPMIISMVLQALYNVVDSVFVANMKGNGAIANQALTIAEVLTAIISAILLKKPYKEKIEKL